MSTFIRKEVRLLLPTATLALLAAGSAWLVRGEQGAESGLRNLLAVFPLVCCPALVVIMALDSFGHELGVGMFPNLLVQPVPRRRIWRTKTLVLGVGVALVYVAWGLSYALHLGGVLNESPSETRAALLTGGAVALAAYSGGLWTVLLFRQAAPAFWFTVLIPAGLAALLSATLGYRYEDQAGALVRGALVAYSAAGFLWARWMFLRAQDTHWTGGDLALSPGRRLPVWRLGWLAGLAGRPRAALLAKELQLQQSQLLLGGLLAALHLAVMAARTLAGDLRQSPVLAFALEEFWIFWLVLPVLVGSAAVAEERKLGTLEGQLCLPARRRTQFAIKFAVVLALSLLLGAILPLLLEGGRILPDTRFTVPAPENLAIAGTVWQRRLLTLGVDMLGLVGAWMPLFILAGVAASLAAMAFYASTLTRNTLQALGPASLGSLAACLLLVGAACPEAVFRYPLWRGTLIYMVGVPLLALTLGRLTYWNFKHALVGWSVWRRNLLWLLGALGLAMALTTTLYHRAWELSGATELARGPSRLAPSELATAESRGVRMVFRWADGRAWAGRASYPGATWRERLTGFERPGLAGGSRFLEGTNWVSVAAYAWDDAGVRSDGSLWVTEPPPQPATNWEAAAALRSQPRKLVRCGTAGDWKSLGGYWGYGAFLLKTNGTLWFWGTNRFNWRAGWPGLGAFEPVQLGLEADWAGLGFRQYQPLFLKADGQTWVHCGSASGPRRQRVDLAPDLSIEPVPDLDWRFWRSLTPLRVRGFWGNAGVRQDGTFRVTPDWEGMTLSRVRRRDLTEPGVPLGRDTNWLAVCSTALADNLVALKTDGSLWHWDFPDDPLRRPAGAFPTRLGTHSDWRALVPLRDGVAGLAADGTLWLWRFERREYYGQIDHPLLGPSRRPVRVGNLFDGAN